MLYVCHHSNGHKNLFALLSLCTRSSHINFQESNSFNATTCFVQYEWWTLWVPSHRIDNRACFPLSWIGCKFCVIDDEWNHKENIHLFVLLVLVSSWVNVWHMSRRCWARCVIIHMICFCFAVRARRGISILFVLWIFICFSRRNCSAAAYLSVQQMAQEFFTLPLNSIIIYWYLNLSVRLLTEELINYILIKHLHLVH